MKLLCRHNCWLVTHVWDDIVFYYINNYSTQHVQTKKGREGDKDKRNKNKKQKRKQKNTCSNVVWLME